MRDNFTALDTVLYYLAVIFTVGGAFISKIIVKKALQEMLDSGRAG
jgi:hypothetical protein